MEENKFKEIMGQGLKVLNLPVKDKILSDYWLYMSFLLQENKKYNLTGITVPEEIIVKHFLDSLAPLPFIDLNPDGKILDAGTGAGFPGLVLKIMKPEIDMILLDATLKKINFLNLLASKLAIKEGLKLVHARAEKLAKKERYRESFKYVLARAVAPLNILCEYTLAFVEKGGSAYFYKGPEYKEELKEAGHSLQIMGGEVRDILKLKVPGLKGKRFLILITKKKITPISYPRKTGIPKKRPL